MTRNEPYVRSDMYNRKTLLNSIYGAQHIRDSAMYNLSEPVLISSFKPYNMMDDYLPNPMLMCFLHCSNFDGIVIGRLSMDNEFLYGESSITLKELGLHVDGWRYL
nr:MAG TPA: hypothetical protein [Caudoviricetes sp.]